MFDFSWSEIMVIGAVALVAIGPKDLPKALRTAGMLVRRARSLAREFHNSVDEMIREAELDEVRRKIDEATRVDLDPAPRISPPAEAAPPVPDPGEPAPPEPGMVTEAPPAAEAPAPEPPHLPPEP